MNLLEFFEQDPMGYRTEKDDNSSLQKDEPRKTRLTLDRLNRLRMMNDVRKLEHERKLEKVTNQYAAPAEAGAAGLGI